MSVSRSFALVVFSVLVGACGITLPNPIFTGQVNSYFAGISDKPLVQKAVEEDAAACASRLNQHRNSARNFHAIRQVIAGLGGVTSGAGGVVSAFAADNDKKTVGGYVAAAGGIVALVGTFIVGLVGDPTDRLNKHSLGNSSWTEAVQLAGRLQNGQGNGSSISDVRGALQRCINDQAPPPPRATPENLLGNPVK